LSQQRLKKSLKNFNAKSAKYEREIKKQSLT